MGATKEIQGQFSLREEVIPQVNWKLFVGAAEASNEMVFEHVNGTFRSIATVDMGWDQLGIDMLSNHEILEGTGCFIIQSLQLGAESGST